MHRLRGRFTGRCKGQGQLACSVGQASSDESLGARGIAADPLSKSARYPCTSHWLIAIFPERVSLLARPACSLHTACTQTAHRLHTDCAQAAHRLHTDCTQAAHSELSRSTSHKLAFCVLPPNLVGLRSDAARHRASLRTRNAGRNQGSGSPGKVQSHRRRLPIFRRLRCLSACLYFDSSSPLPRGRPPAGRRDKRRPAAPGRLIK